MNRCLTSDSQANAKQNQNNNTNYRIFFLENDYVISIDREKERSENVCVGVSLREIQ